MPEKAQLVEQPAVPIQDIPGGGVSEDGRLVYIEMKTLSGQVLALQMPVHLADRLNLATAQFAHMAKSMRKAGVNDPLEATRAVEVQSLQATSIRFQMATDGKSLRLLATGVGGPPLAIDLPIDAVPAFQREVRNLSGAMKRLKKTGARGMA